VPVATRRPTLATSPRGRSDDRVAMRNRTAPLSRSLSGRPLPQWRPHTPLRWRQEHEVQRGRGEEPGERREGRRGRKGVWRTAEACRTSSGIAAMAWAVVVRYARELTARLGCTVDQLEAVCEHLALEDVERLFQAQVAAEPTAWAWFRTQQTGTPM